MTVVIAFGWLGCGNARPSGVPTDAVRVQLGSGELQVGDQVVPRADLLAEPTDAEVPALAAALVGTTGRPMWVDLPEDSPFWLVRKVVESAWAAGAAEVFLGTGDLAVPIAPTPRLGIGTCAGESAMAVGVAPLVTLAIEADARESWVRGSATFLPVLADVGPTVGVEGCVARGPCAPLFSAERASACDAADPTAPGRVDLGGAAGCLAARATGPADAAWRPEIAAAARRLALTEGSLVAVSPEARIRLRGVLAVLAGLRDAGIPRPALSTAALVEGNDGPPDCSASVRDARDLELGAARWLGGRAPVAPPE